MTEPNPADVQITQADGEMAASIRVALIKACPDMPVYPVGVITPLLAAHRIAALQQSRSAVEIMRRTLNEGYEAAVKSSPGFRIKILSETIRAALSQESADA